MRDFDEDVWPEIQGLALSSLQGGRERGCDPATLDITLSTMRIGLIGSTFFHIGAVSTLTGEQFKEDCRDIQRLSVNPAMRLFFLDLLSRTRFIDFGSGYG